MSIQAGSTASDLVQGSTFARQQVISYAKMVDSPLVLGPVIEKLGLGVSVDSLAARTSAESPLNTSLINITVNDGSAAVAAATADAVADQFEQVIEQVETPASGGNSNVRLSVVRQASAPTSPSSPNLKLNVALGLLLGLTLGIAYAVLREILDTRIKSEEDVARVTDRSVLGTIVQDSEGKSKPLIIQGDLHSPRSEGFRRLRTNLQFLESADDKPRSIVVTSSVPGEGKSTTAINLAITLAEAGTRVCLVDADLRRPSVARYLGVEGETGLTTVLIGRATWHDVVQPWGSDQLQVLPAGQIPPNPTELLGSTRMQALIASLVEAYDIVLVDTAPLLPVTDAAILARATDGALVVASAQLAKRQQLAESLAALDKVGAPVLGIVLNRLKRSGRGAYYYYYESIDTGSRASRSRRSSSSRRS